MPKISDFIDQMIGDKDLAKKFLDNPGAAMTQAGLTPAQQQKVTGSDLPTLLAEIWDEDRPRRKYLRFRPVRH
jgi:hypothetical protein